MNRKLTILVFFLNFVNLFSQGYKPIDTADFAKRKQFLDQYKIVNETYDKELKAKYPGTIGKELSKNYSEMQKKFQKEIKNKDYFFSSVFNDRLQAYFAKLKNKNQNIPDNIKIIVGKDNSPNAFCVQDGVFIVNMGLFNWLDNEEQLISILGHELGHKMLNHSVNWQKKLVETEQNSKTEVTQISESKVNRTDKAFNLYKNQIYKVSQHRRKNETEADSIGYVMFRNAGLRKSEYINSLKNLQEFDTISPRMVKLETYRKLFDLPGHPFKDKWMKMEDFSSYNYSNYKEKLDKDSISSHPEVTERINHLKKIFPEISVDEEAVKSEDKDFLELRKIARYEVLPNFFHSEDYGAGIYTAMQFIQDEEQETYHKEWLGTLFNKIFEARKNYTLNRYLDRVDPKNQSESYQQFLNFMWNLSLDDIKYISEFYNKKSPQ